MPLMDDRIQRDLNAGDRYVASNEEAFDYFCEDNDLADEDPATDAAWLALPDFILDEYIFPLVPAHLRD